MPFLIRPSRRFPGQCYVRYSAGPFGAIVASLAIQDDRPRSLFTTDSGSYDRSRLSIRACAGTDCPASTMT